MANNIKLFKSIASLNANDTAELPRDNQEFYDNLQFLMFFIKNMNYVINFFLYSALSTLFRQEFLAIFKESKLFAFFKCNKCVRYKQVITHAKFSRKSESCSEIVFPVNSSSQRPKKYLKIRIESTNLGKYIASKNKIIRASEENQHITTVQQNIHSLPILENDDEFSFVNKYEDKKRETRSKSSPKTFTAKQYSLKNKRNSVQIPLQSFKKISTDIPVENGDELPTNKKIEEKNREIRSKSSTKTITIKQYDPINKRSSIQISLNPFKKISTDFSV
jgi:hypothetical protein